MPRVRNQSLGGRADQAGLLYAAGNTPATFQRTLMPRATMDQALVTGLSASANHALVTLVQDAIQSTALVLVGEARRRSVDEKRWSRATIAADVAAIGAGIAIQRALRARNREPLARAGARTGGYMLAVTGTAGVFVGALQEAFPGNGSRMRQTLAVVGPAGAGLAAFNTWQVRKRARTGRPSSARGLPSFPREINRIRRGNGGCALGVRRGRAPVRRSGVTTLSRAGCRGTRRCGGRSRTRPHSRDSPRAPEYLP